MTVAQQHLALHELVDQLSAAQAEAVRAVVVELVTPAHGTAGGTEDGERAVPVRRRLSFAGTLTAETDFAERAEQVLLDIAGRTAG